MTASNAPSGASSCRGLRIVTGLVLVALLLSACAAEPNEAASSANEAGFWLGLWHGLIAPITFIVSLFNDSVGVYEVDNKGSWYDFAFLLGLSIFFSSGPGASRARRRS